MKKRKGRKRPPRRFRALGADELLGAVLDKYRIRGNVRESRIVQAWPSIVGERIAGRAWPYHIKNGVLLVAVSNSSWLHQLSFAKDDILTKINAAAGGSAPMVTEVRFELAGRLQRRGAVQKQIVRPPPRPTKRSPPPPASGKHLEEIERDSAAVDDPELRDAILKTRKRWDL